ncbi:hypothetical protein [Effusibacillus consociatus]|uniref:DUF4825 domain-containing protein n=1 Tax=Effusibacillus consociatus TaxID=1117041 RepID=A0ABV9PVU0_9BACL
MKKRRSVYMLTSLLVLSALIITVVLPNGFRQSESAQTKQANTENNTFVLNEKEEQILKQVGLVPYINDVLFDETADGKMIVSATAEIGTAPESDKKQLAREVAHKFTVAVYKTGVTVAEASIHITSDNHLVLGTSLGSDHQKKMTQSAMSGSGQSTSEFFQFLKEHETQTEDPVKNTWFYEIP